MKIFIRAIVLACLVPVLLSCANSLGFGAYKAYSGDTRSPMRVATVEGSSYIRRDLINNYVDSVRFLAVDGTQIENSQLHTAIQITPGFHDVRVYFAWDLGRQRGLAPALVNYAATRETLSRTLHFNALAGERYVVRAQPVFEDDARRDITTLSYVDFWIEDRAGNAIVSREEGRYRNER